MNLGSRSTIPMTVTDDDRAWVVMRTDGAAIRFEGPFASVVAAEAYCDWISLSPNCIIAVLPPEHGCPQRDDRDED